MCQADHSAPTLALLRKFPWRRRLQRVLRGAREQDFPIAAFELAEGDRHMACAQAEEPTHADGRRRRDLGRTCMAAMIIMKLQNFYVFFLLWQMFSNMPHLICLLIASGAST